MKGSLRPTQLYDVAVVGSDPGGMVAGALLARRGQRVLHVTTAPPAGPVLLPDWKALPVAKEVLDELALALPLSRALIPTPLQLLSPKERIDLPVEAPWVKEAKGGIEAALSLLAEAPLPPLGWIESWKAKRLSGRTIDGPSLEDSAGVLAALHLFAQHLAGPWPALSFARATAPLLAGIFRLDGGLYEPLRASIRNHQGDVIGEPSKPVKVVDVLIEGGRFAGLHLEGASQPFRARLCLLSQPASTLIPWLPEKFARKQREKARPEASRLVARQLFLDPAGCPEGLGPLALCHGWEEGPVLVENEGGGSIRLFGPSEKAIERALHEVFPFHEGHVRNQAPAPLGSHLHFEPSNGPFGIEGAPLEAALAGVFHTGSDVLPGLGWEGAFRIGRRVADIASKNAPKQRSSITTLDR